MRSFKIIIIGLDINQLMQTDITNVSCLSPKILMQSFILTSGDRLVNAVVRAGMNTDIHSNNQCGSPVTASQAQPLGGVIIFDCWPLVRARYISVDLQDRTNYLQLREVEVEEIIADTCALPDGECKCSDLFPLFCEKL